MHPSGSYCHKAATVIKTITDFSCHHCDRLCTSIFDVLTTNMTARDIILLSTSKSLDYQGRKVRNEGRNLKYCVARPSLDRSHIDRRMR